MNVRIDLRVLHLLCSRLCHDLVGPVGAINNGIELVREFGAGQDDEAIELVASSAQQVAERLKFFRIAYGLATGAARSVRDVRVLAGGVMEPGRMTLDWPADPALDDSGLTDGSIKLLLNMILLGTEALSPAGTVRVRLAPKDGVVIAEVAAVGQGARLAPGIRDGATGAAEVGDLTPRTVQGFFTARLAESEGSRLAVAAAEDSVVLTAALRPNAP